MGVQPAWAAAAAVQAGQHVRWRAAAMIVPAAEFRALRLNRTSQPWQLQCPSCTGRARMQAARAEARRGGRGAEGT
eukprot:scaffold18149_cov129-Isochrysis_galbana.AAC.5